MSERVDNAGEIVQHNGEDCKVLANGALWSLKRKHIVGALPGGNTTAIQTSEQASAMQALRLERKRERIQAGALAAIRDGKPDVWADAEGLDWVEAVAEAQTQQALRVGDPGMTRAADWLMTHAGLAEQRQAEQAPVQRVVHEVDPATLALLRDIAERQRDVVDGTVADA